MKRFIRVAGVGDVRAGEGRHVEIGDHTILGGFVGIHQFCKVGAHTMLGVAAVALKDVPPFLMVYGNPARPYGLNLRGLKRRGFGERTLTDLKQTYKTVFRSGLTVEQALAELAPVAAREPRVAEFVAFVRDSGRGIVR